MPIREGSGTGLSTKGFSEVRKGDGTVLFSKSTIPDSGVTLYEFEQDLTDSWGGNDAVDNTSAGYSTTAQYGTYAKAFDGVDDDIDTTIETVGSTGGEYSLAFWLYYRGSTSSFQRFMGNYGNTGDDIWIGNNGGGDLRFQDDKAGAPIASGALETDTWIHVVMAVDSNGVEGYKNGSSIVTAGTGRSSASSTGQNFLIGQERNGNYADMIVDNFKYFDKRLSDTEASNLYNTGSIDG